jgi:uncharacterized protein involved in type VI secretion and phage assembly
MASTPFYGKFRGIVTDNQDPLKIGRIRAKVPDIYGGDDSGWAMPCAPFGGPHTGFFALPTVGAGVWIECEHGDPDYPIWTGTWWGSAAEIPGVVAATPPMIVMIQSPRGSSVTINDTADVDGLVLQSASGAKISIGTAGIVLDDGEGAKITLSGPTVSVNDGAVEVR